MNIEYNRAMLIRRVLAIIIVFTWIIPFVIPTSAAGENPPAAAFVADIAGRAVKGSPQSYALSCEARSAVDLAAFWGIEIGEREFLKRLPRSDNPEVGFVGDPNGIWGYIPPYSYGVHARPVAQQLKEYGLLAEARTGLSWPELQLEIASGRPVIVWIIGEMWPGKPVTYKAHDGNRVQVASFEHTMILIGYNRKKVEAIDAFSGEAKRFPLETFLKSWYVLGNMAVIVRVAEPTEQTNQAYLTAIMLNQKTLLRPSQNYQEIFSVPGPRDTIRLYQNVPRLSCLSIY